jgi:hypothetical protein
MLITQQHVDLARKRVHDRWGQHIPRELQQLPTNQVFIIHTNSANFGFEFNKMWNPGFQLAVKRDCTVSNMTMDPNIVYSQGVTCIGFVTDDRDHRKRRVHIDSNNPGKEEFDPIGALAHEYIHFLSHTNFYPDYYMVGVDNPYRVEGVTDWLTVNCFSDYYQDLPVASRVKALQAYTGAP